MGMASTDAIISEVEKNHECVIQKNISSQKVPTFVADGGSTAGVNVASAINLPYHSMFFVNDKEVKLFSGQRITIVVGDLAQQRVYLNCSSVAAQIICFHSQ